MLSAPSQQMHPLIRPVEFGPDAYRSAERKG